MAPVTGAWSRVGWRHTGPSSPRGQQHGAPTAATGHPSQLLTLGIGAVYTLVGLLGLVVTGSGDFVAEADNTRLGFELEPLHNLVRRPSIIAVNQRGQREGKEVIVSRPAAPCRSRGGNDMGRRAVVLLALLLALALTVLAAPAATAATESSTVLSARLTGEKEVPGPGDPNGVGSARIRLGERRVCFTLRWRRIAPPTAAHIHVGPPGVAGPVVVPLFAAPGGLPPELSGVSGCVRGVDPALIRAIRQHPHQYYVNIHNVPFPDGAIRGQLHRADN